MSTWVESELTDNNLFNVIENDQVDHSREQCGEGPLTLFSTGGREYYWLNYSQTDLFTVYGFNTDCPSKSEVSHYPIAKSWICFLFRLWDQNLF